MKVFIKKLDGTKFEIEVNPQDTVADIKNIIETNVGEDLYPAARQGLIHRGKILKNGTTLMENNIAENDSILVIESPNKTWTGSSSAEGTSDQHVLAPSMLELVCTSDHPILTKLENHNPEAVNTICENYKFLNEYEHPDGVEDWIIMYVELEEDDSEKDKNPPRIWTDDELMAITRLEHMGFDRYLASEVFYACKKDEQAAGKILNRHMRFN